MTVYTADWVLPVDSPPIERGGVLVEDGRILAVGPASELAGEVEHAPDAAILPGFVNAHTHLEYAVYAGFGEGLPLGPWLDVHIERKRRLDWPDFLAVARVGAADCLASGITTVADLGFSGAGAVACDELGLRAIVCLEVFGSDPEEGLATFARHRDRIEPALSDRVRLGVSPHAPYSAGHELYAAAAALGLPVATHVAESDHELAFMLRGEGPLARVAELCGVSPPGTTPVRHLAAHGLLGPAVTAAHCVKLDAEEIDLLARHDVAVAHCPRSNALLGCGVAPLRALLDAGIRVGLGTDSPASTASFDMFDEMRAAVAHARAAASDAGALSATDALRLATLGAARALRLDGEIGSLTPGKRADLAIVSLSGSPYLPWEDPEVAVVFGGTPERVWRTIVGGVTRHSRGGPGWHEHRRAAASARGRMLAHGDKRSSG